MDHILIQMNNYWSLIEFYGVSRVVWWLVLRNVSSLLIVLDIHVLFSLSQTLEGTLLTGRSNPDYYLCCSPENPPHSDYLAS